MRNAASGISNAGLVSQTMHTHMKGVSRIAQPLHGIDALEDTLATQSRIGLWTCFRDIALCPQYEPTTSTRAAGTLQALISPDFISDFLEFWEFFLLQWEVEVFRFSDRDSRICRAEQGANSNSSITATASSSAELSLYFRNQHQRVVFLRRHMGPHQGR
eukprot:863156-Amphidinium_carterae.1